MKYEIKKIDIWSTAKFTGIFYGLVALIPMLFGLITLFFSSFRNGGFNIGMLMIFLIPLIVFVAGFIAGLLFALVYNQIAERMGGFKMEIEYTENK